MAPPAKKAGKGVKNRHIARCRREGRPTLPGAVIIQTLNTMTVSAVTGIIKLALDAGKANPAPPVGPALGAKVVAWGIYTFTSRPGVRSQRWLSTRPALQGVNIMAFCKEYNAATQDKMGQIIPVEITVFEVRRNDLLPCAHHFNNAVMIMVPVTLALLCFVQDRSFTFILKTPPASFLIRKAAGIPKGSGAPNTQKVGSLTTAQLKVCAMSCRT